MCKQLRTKRLIRENMPYAFNGYTGVAFPPRVEEQREMERKHNVEYEYSVLHDNDLQDWKLISEHPNYDDAAIDGFSKYYDSQRYSYTRGNRYIEFENLSTGEYVFCMRARTATPYGDGSFHYSNDICGYTEVTRVVSTEADELPQALTLSSYPNPFNPQTTIEYALPDGSHVSIQAFDVIGRLVSTIYEGYRSGGTYEALWTISDVSSGQYVIRLTTDYGVKHILAHVLK